MSRPVLRAEVQVASAWVVEVTSRRKGRAWPAPALWIAGAVKSAVRCRHERANPDHPAATALTQLLEVTFGPKAVIAEEFAIPHAEQVVIFGSWAARYAGQAGPPPHDIDVLVVGKVNRADLYEAADRAQARLGLEVNPVVRSVRQWENPADALVAQIKASAFVVVLDHPELVDA